MKTWLPKEDERLEKLWRMGYGPVAIGLELGRSASSVDWRRKANGLPKARGKTREARIASMQKNQIAGVITPQRRGLDEWQRRALDDAQQRRVARGRC